MLLFVCSVGCSVILIAGNWIFLLKIAKIATVFLSCFNTTTFLHNLVSTKNPTENGMQRITWISGHIWLPPYGMLQWA